MLRKILTGDPNKTERRETEQEQTETERRTGRHSGRRWEFAL